MQCGKTKKSIIEIKMGISRDSFENSPSLHVNCSLKMSNTVVTTFLRDKEAPLIIGNLIKNCESLTEKFIYKPTQNTKNCT